MTVKVVNQMLQFEAEDVKRNLKGCYIICPACDARIWTKENIKGSIRRKWQLKLG